MGSSGDSGAGVSVHHPPSLQHPPLRETDPPHPAALPPEWAPEGPHHPHPRQTSQSLALPSRSSSPPLGAHLYQQAAHVLSAYYPDLMLQGGIAGHGAYPSKAAHPQSPSELLRHPGTLTAGSPQQQQQRAAHNSLRKRCTVKLVPPGHSRWQPPPQPTHACDAGAAHTAVDQRSPATLVEGQSHPTPAQAGTPPWATSRQQQDPPRSGATPPPPSPGGGGGGGGGSATTATTPSLFRSKMLPAVVKRGAAGAARPSLYTLMGRMRGATGGVGVAASAAASPAAVGCGGVGVPPPLRPPPSVGVVGYEGFCESLERFVGLTGCRDLSMAWGKLTKWIDLFHVEERRDSVEATVNEIVEAAQRIGGSPLHRGRQALTLTAMHQLLQLLSLTHPKLAGSIDTIHRELLFMVFADFNPHPDQTALPGIASPTTTPVSAGAPATPGGQSVPSASAGGGDVLQLRGVAVSAKCTSLAFLQVCYRRLLPYHEALREALAGRDEVVQERGRMEVRSGKLVMIGDMTVGYWQRHLKKRILRAWLLQCTGKKREAERAQDKQQIQDLQGVIKRMQEEARVEQGKKEVEVRALHNTIASLEGEMATAERLIGSLQDRLDPAMLHSRSVAKRPSM